MGGGLDAGPRIVGLDLGLDRLKVGVGGVDLAQEALVALELGPVVSLQRHPALVLLYGVEEDDVGPDVVLEGHVGAAKGPGRLGLAQAGLGHLEDLLDRGVGVDLDGDGCDVVDVGQRALPRLCTVWASILASSGSRARVAQQGS